MKLSTRNPKLLTTSETRSGMGLELDCPCPKCVTGPKAIRCGVWFANPLDGGKPNPKAGKLWRVEGASIEDLTITTPIDVSHIGHWIGTIEGGGIVGGYEPPAEPDPEVAPPPPAMPEGDEPLEVGAP